MSVCVVKLLFGRISVKSLEKKKYLCHHQIYHYEFHFQTYHIIKKGKALSLSGSYLHRIIHSCFAFWAFSFFGYFYDGASVDFSDSISDILYTITSIYWF